MSFLSKLLISAPVNVFSTLGLGAPFGPVPSGLGFLFFASPAGEGSDRVPLVMMTPDGSAFKLAGDPSQTWRSSYDGEPVSIQHQAVLAANWATALNDINALLPPLFNPYKILEPTRSIISPDVNTRTTDALNWIVRKDPLVLDLDGGGITTSAINPAAPILFDADGDGTLTATGWIAASDAQFANLRVWKDLNQDGISQTGELKTLADSGIQSIGLTSSTRKISYTDTILTQKGTFTRSDNTAGQVGSFILAQNFFLLEFKPITVGAAAQALPNVGGARRVRDLPPTVRCKNPFKTYIRHFLKE